MKKIIAFVEPFSIEQKVFVYEEGLLIDQNKCELEKIDENIDGLSKKHDINNIHIIGPIQYTKKVKEKIENYEINKYNNNNLSISLNTKI